MQPNMPLMQQGAPAEDEGSEEEYNEVASDLIFESAKAFLLQPETTQHLMKSLQGAKDMGTAIGKMAAMVVSRITGELEKADLGVGEEPVFGAEGGLTKVLTAIYYVANLNGLQLSMEDSMVQAFEVAEADLEKLFAAQKGGGPEMGGMPPEQAPTEAPPMGPAPAPQGAPLMGAA